MVQGHDRLGGAERARQLVDVGRVEHDARSAGDEQSDPAPCGDNGNRGAIDRLALEPQDRFARGAIFAPSPPEP